MNKEDIFWYQGCVSDILGKQDQDKVTCYYRILHAIEQRGVALNLSLEHVYCETTDTINMAGHRDLFLGMDMDLKGIGFKRKSIPEKSSLDALQKEEFRQMILNGGTYAG